MDKLSPNPHITIDKLCPNSQIDICGQAFSKPSGFEGFPNPKSTLNGFFWKISPKNE
jgi:hypothetical protein